MKHAFLSAIMLATTFVPALGGAEITAFNTIFDRYELIRQELIEDSTRGVAEQAEAIAKTAAALQRNYTDAAAGVGLESETAVKALLPEIENRAAALAETGDLETARSALAELTKPLVRWHELIEGPRPVVAYCSMVKKAWLQPDEAIGNPYAPYMLRCGEVVQR